MPKDVLEIEDLEALSKKIIGFSKAEWAEVSLESGYYANLRFAANTVTTSGSHVNTSVGITAVNGKRSGHVSTNDLSDDGLRRAMKRAEEISQLAPENEELMPPLAAKQEYLKSSQFDESSTDRAYTAAERSKVAQMAIKEGTARTYDAAGFVESSIRHRAYRNSKGLFVGDRSTRSLFSTTMRNAEGTSSGWNKRASHAIARLDAKGAIKRASEKCLAWESPVEMDPGVYAAILEPSVTADIVQQLIWSLDARSAEEGRSAFSRPGGKTAQGDSVGTEKVRIYSEPNHLLAPGGIYSDSGLPTENIDWIKGGIVQNFSRGRYWAQKTNQRPVPGPSNILMEGGDMLPDDFLTKIPDGLLITSVWYIRDVDDQTLLKTGLTRDGLFMIENGAIKHGVVNFRWNESPLNVIKNIVGMSKPVVTAPRDGWDGISMYMPMIHVSKFNFSSISDAV